VGADADVVVDVVVDGAVDVSATFVVCRLITSRCPAARLLERS